MKRILLAAILGLLTTLTVAKHLEAQVTVNDLMPLCTTSGYCAETFIELSTSSGGDFTITGDELIWNNAASTYTFRTSSVDAADSKTVVLTSAGAAGVTRGGGLLYSGNEVATTGGSVSVSAGNVSTANIDLNMENAASSIRFRDTTTGTLMSINNTGQIVQDATNGPVNTILINKDNSSIGVTNTSDAADNLDYGISFGGGLDTSRGAFIFGGGNEGSSNGGMEITAGNTASGHLNIQIEHASAQIRFRDVTTGTLLAITDSGSISQDATNGSLSFHIVNRDDTLLGVAGTSDTADNLDYSIAFGGAVGATRGASVTGSGNEGTGTGSLVAAVGDIATAFLDLNTENAASAVRFRDTTTGTLASINNSGQWVQDATNGALNQHLVNRDNTILAIGNTSDAADNIDYSIAFGGAADTTRGAFITGGGNEATNTGALILGSGNVSGGNVIAAIGAGSGVFRVRNSAAVMQWEIAATGGMTNGTSATSPDINFAKSGSTIAMQEATGSTACMGVATPNGNTNVTVTTSCAVTGARVFYSRVGAITNMGVITTTGAPDNTDFDFASTGASDTTASSVIWWIIKEAA